MTGTQGIRANEIGWNRDAAKQHESRRTLQTKRSRELKASVLVSFMMGYYKDWGILFEPVFGEQ